MSILNVGSGLQYSTISAAVAASSSGDTVDVSAGTYTNDFPTISHSLTLQAVGGPVNLVATQAPANGKGIIDAGGSGTNVTISGLDISGAQVADGNGAGVRYEGGSLTLSNDTIHDNQDGLLANADPNGTITINNSTFAHNGSGDGATHNIYVGDIASLTVQSSTITGAVVGHEIKSRAESTTITGNTITDGAAGTASYDIDLPNGGNAVVTGNVIEKGPNAQNPIAISFGEEGSVHANSSLTVQGNTLLNDETAHYTTAVRNATSAPATASGNQLYGWSSATSGPVSASGNTVLTSEPALSSVSPQATSTGASVSTLVAAGTSGGAAQGSADAGTAATTASQGDGGTAPISAATVGSSSNLPIFIAGNSAQQGSPNAGSSQQAADSASGGQALAAFGTPSGTTPTAVQVSGFLNGSGSTQHWSGHVRAGGGAAHMLTNSSGQHAAVLPAHAGGMLA